MLGQIHNQKNDEYNKLAICNEKKISHIHSKKDSALTPHTKVDEAETNRNLATIPLHFIAGIVLIGLG
jgi:hypothetical protein